MAGDRQLYERETEDGHVVDVMISEVLFYCFYFEMISSLITISKRFIFFFQKKTVSLNPRVKVIHDFLTAKECELLIAEGKDRLSPSYVVGKKVKRKREEKK